MQRDLKIGLSLAVLLLGVVGALFFRKDDVELAGYPELQNQEQLNRQIAEKPRAPYLDDNASISASPKKRVQKTARPTTTEAIGEDPLEAGEKPRSEIAEEQSPRAGTEDRPRPAPRRPSITSEDDQPGILADEQPDTVSPPVVTKPPRSQPAPKTRPTFPADDTEPTAAPPARAVGPVESPRKVATDRTLPVKPAPQPATKKPLAPAQDSVTAAPAVAPQGIKDLTSDTDPAEEQDSPAEKQDRAAAVRRPMMNPSTAHKDNLPRMFIPPTRTPPFAMPAPVTPRRTPRIVEEESQDGIDKEPNSDQRKVYRIRSRDTLERIAEREYGDRRKATQIYEANKDSLESPDQLREGKDLVLP